MTGYLCRSSTLGLRHLVEDDLADVQSWMAGAGREPWQYGSADLGLDELTAALTMAAEVPWLDFFAFDKPDGSLVAMGGWQPDQQWDGVLVFADVLVAPEARSAAVGLHTLLLLVEHAFSHPEIHKVVGHVAAANAAIIAVAERVGFRLEGTLRRHLRTPEGWFDVLSYGLLREEYHPAATTARVVERALA